MILSADSMVFLGCSYTKGVGLRLSSECYTSIMSADLNKKEINCNKGGSSNYNSFDNFSKLEFAQPHVPMVLQITELSRIKHYDAQKNLIRDRLLSNEPSRTLLEIYTDKFLIYELERHLNLSVKYARSMKINLIIWSIARVFDFETNQLIKDCLTQFKEYVCLSNDLASSDGYRVDNGADGTHELGTGHPGPESHKLIAEKLLVHYKKLYQ
jgi:hypothetical protein